MAVEYLGTVPLHRFPDDGEHLVLEFPQDAGGFPFFNRCQSLTGFILKFFDVLLQIESQLGQRIK